jgi:hypothetical protein
VRLANYVESVVLSGGFDEDLRRVLGSTDDVGRLKF